jgi:hypothetical protein
VIVEELTQFPSRAEVSQYNPDDYRLRLLINESRFILAKGDGYSDDNQPKKLFLIDTPGGTLVRMILPNRMHINILLVNIILQLSMFVMRIV